MDESPANPPASLELLEQSACRVEKLLADLTTHRAQVQSARTLDARARDEGVRHLGDAIRSAEVLLEKLRAAIARHERGAERGEEP